MELLWKGHFARVLLPLSIYCGFFSSSFPRPSPLPHATVRRTDSFGEVSKSMTRARPFKVAARDLDVCLMKKRALAPNRRKGLREGLTTKSTRCYRAKMKETNVKGAYRA